MHIVIGLITAIAGLLWALHALQRAGVDLNSFNPFTWWRRRKWDKMYYAHPAFTADNPMDIAAVLLLHAVQLKGALTRETREALLEIFRNTFKIGPEDADTLFTAASFKLKDGLFGQHTARFIKERWESLSEAQARQIVTTVSQVVQLDGVPNAPQGELVRLLQQKTAPQPGTNW